MRILIIEDDAPLSATICQVLAPLSCTVSSSLTSGFDQMEKHWDLILLDLNLPDGSGLEFLRALREFSDVPVIIISSRHTTEDILLGYGSEADDYLIKPFSLEILRAKTDRILFRNRTIRRFGSLLCPEKGTLLNSGQTITALTATESAILSGLFSSPACSSHDLIRRIYSLTSRETSLRTLSSRISELRQKLVPLSLQITGSAQTGYSLKSLD